jgi:hypothetical protein
MGSSILGKVNHGMRESAAGRRTGTAGPGPIVQGAADTEMPLPSDEVVELELPGGMAVMAGVPFDVLRTSFIR